jgi:hypothetical protein
MLWELSMKALWIMSELAMALLMASHGRAELSNDDTKTVIVPRDQIWANSMPGTRDIAELAAKQEKLTGVDLWTPIVDSLEGSSWRPQEGQPAKPAFIVPGGGLKAYRAAHAVLTGDKKVQRVIPDNDEVSLVFFSHPVQAGIELQKVVLRKNVIELQYRFIGRMERYLTSYFALIPLGKVEAGKYDVKVVQMPSVQKINDVYIQNEPPLRSKTADQYISGSFSFEIIRNE